MRKLTGYEMLTRLSAVHRKNYPNYSKFLRARVEVCGYMTERPNGKRSFDYCSFETALLDALKIQQDSDTRLGLVRRNSVKKSCYHGRAKLQAEGRL